MKKTIQYKKWPFIGLFCLPMLAVFFLIYNQSLGFDPSAAKIVNKTSFRLNLVPDNYWYIVINMATLFFPFLLSFDKKVHYYKQWKALLPATAIIGAFFILWDVFFTAKGVWGFNPKYYYTTILGLPIGEWLFFVTVPYACVFIFDCLNAYSTLR